MFGKAHSLAKLHFSLCAMRYARLGKQRGTLNDLTAVVFILVGIAPCRRVLFLSTVFFFYIKLWLRSRCLRRVVGVSTEKKGIALLTAFWQKYCCPCVKAQRLLACFQLIPFRVIFCFFVSHWIYVRFLYEVNPYVWTESNVFSDKELYAKVLRQ